MARWLGVATFLIGLGLCLAPAEAGDAPKKGTGKKGDATGFFRALDADRDGRLSKEEFLRIADRYKAQDRPRARAGLTRALEAADPENRGLTPEQFRKLLEARR